MHRTGISQQERSEGVQLELAARIEKSPHRENLSFAIAADHILRIADDNCKRTNGKRRSWPTHYKNGNPMPHAQRVKSVASLMGSMITLEPRRTRTWVLDAFEDAFTYWPWGTNEA